MNGLQASIYVLPILRLTRASDTPGKGFSPIDHQVRGERVRYWREVNSKKDSRCTAFLKFPIVQNADGSPWEPAVLWLIDRAQANPRKLSSLLPIAQALRDFKVFLDELDFAWDDFSSIEKVCRPTYLYKTHLEDLVSSGNIKPSTANRRMSTVIGLYRFAQQDHRLRLKPANAPWVETRIGLRYTDAKGFKQVKSIMQTDIRVRVPSGEDALDASISDGGKLRPMSSEEQKALICALRTLGNIECSLMHYLGIFTGGREMTVMTLRLGGFVSAPSAISTWPYKVRCGPGTGIDTKFDKSDVNLVIPEALYRMLHVYAISERAKKRRSKSRLGESPLNYLFLTSQGNPYYESKDDRNTIHETTEPLKRTSAQGQALREFISKYVIPEVQKTLPHFRYKFHDTRATFGMNWIDSVMCTKDAGGEKYHWAMEQLRKLMWHKSTVTTEKYLQYRRNVRELDAASKGWSSFLLEMIEPISQQPDQATAETAHD